VVGAAAGADRLAAHDLDAAHQRVRAQLVEEARLADAALAGDEQAAAAAAEQRLEVRLRRDPVFLAADERRRLQEALAHRGRLGPEGHAGGLRERRDHRRRRREAHLGSAREQARDDLPQRTERGQALVARLALDHPAQELIVIFGIKRILAGQQLAGDDPDGVQIAGLARWAAEQDLGRDVAERARDLGPLPLPPVPAHGQPKVQRLDLRRAVLASDDQDIGRLNIRHAADAA
jgi:hypothetical protein